jgi:hypothetical protein
MADIHESLVRTFRKTKLRGFRQTRCPMPTYRPDVFAEKIESNGSVREQIAVEAEIFSTLFSEHTSSQLVLLDEFINHQRRKRIKVRGYLLVPTGKKLFTQAKSLLDALFPKGTEIRIMQR